MAAAAREKLDTLSEHCQRRFVRAILRTLADRLAPSNVRISRMGEAAAAGDQ